MFEAAELGRKISKAEFQKFAPRLRSDLLEAQRLIREKKIPVILIVGGVDGAGKGDVIHRLNEWLDPRGLDTHSFWLSSDEEEERPRFWRFWRVMPSRGRIAILFGSWYTRPIVARVNREIKKAQFDAQLARIRFFESMLAADGAVLVKLWFHLSEKAQYKRLKELESDKRTRHRVLPADWEHHKRYAQFRAESERALRETDSGEAPWHVIEAVDKRFCDVRTAQILLESIQQAAQRSAPAGSANAAIPALKGPTVLDRLKMNRTIAVEKYEDELEKWQCKLNKLVWKAARKKISTIMVMEGWDASGKGGAIRRVTQAIDPRLYRVIPVAAPTDEERAHHYLWRFWRHLPRAGMFTIFDRSWYGRVLVERVEGFATQNEWSRGYLEINEFEQELDESGTVIFKFWLHISKEEQLRRFREREQIDYKKHKITAEDWRNREKWEPYKHAINDMVARTSTEFAPWTLVPANDKKFARIEIVKTIARRLQEAL